MSSAEANKAVFRRFHQEVLLEGRLDAIDDLVDTHVVSHNPIPGQGAGAAGLKLAMAGFRAAFPDLQSQMQDLIAEGDKVACRFTASATHRGEFLGLQPTGAHFTYEEMVMVRIRSGKITEHWAVADVVDMMVKMGAMQYTAATDSRQGG